MPKIILETRIKADIQTCFDIARSIDLHQISTAHTNERAIAGVTSGLIGMGESVTWEARHFGIKQQLSSKITAFSAPTHFRDEMLKGAFSFIVHDHYFIEKGEFTLMQDVFRYGSPLGCIGQLFNRLVLNRYLTKLLEGRNNIIKTYAEQDLK